MQTSPSHLGDSFSQTLVLLQVGTERVRAVDGGGSFVTLNLKNTGIRSVSKETFLSTRGTTVPRVHLVLLIGGDVVGVDVTQASNHHLGVPERLLRLQLLTTQRHISG